MLVPAGSSSTKPPVGDTLTIDQTAHCRAITDLKRGPRSDLNIAGPKTVTQAASPEEIDIESTHSLIGLECTVTISDYTRRRIDRE